jgi:hypothetical protein
VDGRLQERCDVHLVVSRQAVHTGSQIRCSKSGLQFSSSRSSSRGGSREAVWVERGMCGGLSGRKGITSTVCSRVASTQLVHDCSLRQQQKCIGFGYYTSWGVWTGVDR